MIFKILALSSSIAMLSLFGCGNGSDAAQTESYTYSYEYNGCKTGKQVADSQSGYCKNLANDAMNNYCAEWIRKDRFDKDCKNAGVDWGTSS